MKNQWNRKQLDICYRNTVSEFGNGYQHAEKQGIPRFIEDYRIARVKDTIAPWIVGEIENPAPPGVEKKRVLDIGCGHGWYPFHLIDKWKFKGHIIGVDISTHNINIFQNEIKKRKYSDKLSANIANAENLPFPENTFDTVYSTEALEHIESTEKFFNEATRVLKPGGKLIITTPSGPIHHLWIALFWIPSKIKRVFHKRERVLNNQVFERSLSWKQIRSAYNPQKLRIEKYQKSVILPHESYIQFFPGFAQKILLIIAQILEKLAPLTQWMGLHHIICFIKIRKST